MGLIRSLDDLVGMLARRRLLIVAVAALGTVLALHQALSRPRIYQASAVIQVEDSAAGPAAAQRLQSIQRRLTTRENLLAVIDRHGLYAGLPLGNDAKVALLRQALAFQTVAGAGAQDAPAAAVSAVIILARADDAQKAARIANDLAQAMLDAGAGAQAGPGSEVLALLAAEERRLAAELAAAEADLGRYRTGEDAALPALREALHAEIRAVEADMRDIEARAAALRAGSRAREVPADMPRGLPVGEPAGLVAQRLSLSAERDRLAAALARVQEAETVVAGFDRRVARLRAQVGQAARRRAEAERAERVEDRRQAVRLLLLERAVTPEDPLADGRPHLVAAGAAASLAAGLLAAFLLDHLRPVLRTSAQFERRTGLRPMVAIPEIGHRRGARAAPGPAGAAAVASAGRWRMAAAAAAVATLAALAAAVA